MSVAVPVLAQGYSLFCDDVRLEQGNKISLMGCYSGEMIVPGHLPLTLPSLGCLIVWHDAPINLPRKLKIVVRREIPGEPDTDLLAFEDELQAPPADLPLPPESPEGDSPTLLELRLTPKFTAFVVTHPRTRIKVRAYIGDAEHKLGSLWITVVSPSDMPGQVFNPS